MRQSFFLLVIAVAFANIPAIAAGPTPHSTFLELEARGTRIGAIRIDSQNIFDLDDPAENNWLFRTANRLHVRTRPAIIEKSLLFHTGEPVSARLIEETERLLRTRRYLYDIEIRPGAVHDGVVDVDVVTRDTWTLNLTGKFSRSGGTNSTAFGFKELNVLGTGATLGFSQVSDVDRHGNELEIEYPRVFDDWTEASLRMGHFSDGRRTIASLQRPFYSFDSRWAAGVSWDDNERDDAIYNAGNVIARFRHRSKNAEVFGGWSPGLVRNFTQRFSVGALLQEDDYGFAPGETAPSPFPVDHDVRGPFVRYQMVEDRFLRTRNRDQIARTEFVALGLDLRAQVTRAFESWGSSRSAWLYSFSVADGAALPWGHDVLGSVSAERRIGSDARSLDHLGASVRYFGPHGTHSALYGSLAYDRINEDAAAPDLLLLGGDTGLRGYPLRYQAGTRRALATLEERVYTDWYLFRLVRVGGAAFVDSGRAWGGPDPNVLNRGWLTDVGIGLRLAVDRAAFANVLHMDVALPLQRAPGTRRVQYLVKTQLTF